MAREAHDPFGLLFDTAPTIVPFVAPEPVTQDRDEAEVDELLDETDSSPAEKSRWKRALKKVFSTRNIIGAGGVALSFAIGKKHGLGPESAVANLTGFLDGLDRAEKESFRRAGLKSEQERQGLLDLDAAQGRPVGGELAQRAGVAPGVIDETETAFAQAAEQQAQALKRTKLAGVYHEVAKGLKGEPAGFTAWAAALELEDADPSIVGLIRDAGEAAETSAGEASKFNKTLTEIMALPPDKQLERLAVMAEVFPNRAAAVATGISEAKAEEDAAGARNTASIAGRRDVTQMKIDADTAEAALERKNPTQGKMSVAALNASAYSRVHPGVSVDQALAGFADGSIRADVRTQAEVSRNIRDLVFKGVQAGRQGLQQVTAESLGDPQIMALTRQVYNELKNEFDPAGTSREWSFLNDMLGPPDAGRSDIYSGFGVGNGLP